MTVKLLDAWRRRWRRRRRRRRGHHLHVTLHVCVPPNRSRRRRHEDVEPLARRLVMPRNPPPPRDVVGAKGGHEQAQTPRLARRVDDIVDVPRAVVRDRDERGHRAAVWKLSNRAGDLHRVGSVSSHLRVQLRRGYPVAVPEPRPRAVRRRGDAKRAGDDDAVAQVALQRTRAGEGRPRLDLRQQRARTAACNLALDVATPASCLSHPKRRPHLQRPAADPAPRGNVIEPSPAATRRRRHSSRITALSARCRSRSRARSETTMEASHASWTPRRAPSPRSPARAPTRQSRTDRRRFDEVKPEARPRPGPPGVGVICTRRYRRGGGAGDHRCVPLRAVASGSGRLWWTVRGGSTRARRGRNTRRR